MAGRRRGMMHDEAFRGRLLEAIGRLRNIEAVAAELGVSGTTIRSARRCDPEFAAACTAVLCSPLPMPYRHVVSWTAERRERFVEILARTGSPRKAAVAVRASPSQAYGLRDSDAEFAAAWSNARARAYDLLEGETLDRAINGVERTVVAGGKTQVVRHYDLGIALKLLTVRWAKSDVVPRGRVIELTPELIAASRRTMVTQLIEHGQAGLER